jgi:hypothetical protein
MRDETAHEWGTRRYAVIEVRPLAEKKGAGRVRVVGAA